MRSNEVMCGHRFLDDDGNTKEFQIHCTLQRGLMEHVLTFINFLAFPAPLQEQPGLVAVLSTQDGSVTTSMFPVLATRADDGSLVVNVPSREHVNECLTVLASGQTMVLRLGTKTGVKAQMPLANDDGFRRCYDQCVRQLGI